MAALATGTVGLAPGQGTRPPDVTNVPTVISIAGEAFASANPRVMGNHLLIQAQTASVRTALIRIGQAVGGSGFSGEARIEGSDYVYQFTAGFDGELIHAVGYNPATGEWDVVVRVFSTGELVDAITVDETGGRVTIADNAGVIYRSLVSDPPAANPNRMTLRGYRSDISRRNDDERGYVTHWDGTSLTPPVELLADDREYVAGVDLDSYVCIPVNTSNYQSADPAKSALKAATRVDGDWLILGAPESFFDHATDNKSVVSLSDSSPEVAVRASIMVAATFGQNWTASELRHPVTSAGLNRSLIHHRDESNPVLWSGVVDSIRALVSRAFSVEKPGASRGAGGLDFFLVAGQSGSREVILSFDAGSGQLLSALEFDSPPGFMFGLGPSDGHIAAGQCGWLHLVDFGTGVHSLVQFDIDGDGALSNLKTFRFEPNAEDRGVSVLLRDPYPGLLLLYTQTDGRARLIARDRPEDATGWSADPTDPGAVQITPGYSLITGDFQVTPLSQIPEAAFTPVVPKPPPPVTFPESPPDEAGFTLAVGVLEIESEGGSTPISSLLGLDIQRVGNSVRLTWPTAPGATYELFQLTGPQLQARSSVATFPGSLAAPTFLTPIGGEDRYFQLERRGPE